MNPSLFAQKSQAQDVKVSEKALGEQKVHVRHSVSALPVSDFLIIKNVNTHILLMRE